MEKVRIAAGIVLYNPDRERLRQNLMAISPQVEQVYIVDNASDNLAEVESLLQELTEANSFVTLIRNDHNAGIARALNQLMHLGMQQGMDWVLTLDQDSVCPAHLISHMLPHALSQKQAGILSPLIEDRSFGLEHTPEAGKELTKRTECITSASLTRLEAWKEAGGFDERLFIDAVDTDFCLSLREHGWLILQVNDVRLLHEIGHGATRHVVCSRTYIAFNHAPWRYYYMARNMVYLSRKHPGFLRPAPFRSILTMTARMMVILLWEREQRLAKCRQVLRGILHGVRM